MITNKLTSKSLDQILEVIKKSKTNYLSGSPIHTSIRNGIEYVRKAYNLKYQTIEDGCRRRLGLKTIDDFRRVLLEYFNGNPNTIISILREHTDVDLHNKINEFFKVNIASIKKINEGIKNEPLSEQNSEVFSFRLDEETSKKLKLILGYIGISPSEWISKKIKKEVDEEVERLFKLLMEKK